MPPMDGVWTHKADVSCAAQLQQTWRVNISDRFTPTAFTRIRTCSTHRSAKVNVRA